MINILAFLLRHGMPEKFYDGFSPDEFIKRVARKDTMTRGGLAFSLLIIRQRRRLLFDIATLCSTYVRSSGDLRAEKLLLLFFVCAHVEENR
jgi:hypothetical protein